MYIIKQCIVCESEFIPNSGVQKTCSRLCFVEYRKYRRKENNKEKTCALCGKVFKPTNKDQTYCTGRCASVARSKIWVEHKTIKTCRYCEKSFVSSLQEINRAYCSKQCREKDYLHNNPEKDSDRRRKRRAITRGIDAEYIDCTTVYRRDHNICQLCGKKVDMKLKYPHKLSASIDHVIPLSKGGTHRYANVQLAHFRCNTLKETGTTERGEQLRIC